MKLTSAEIKSGLAIAPISNVAGTVTGVEIDRLGFDSVVISCLTGLAANSPTVQSASFQIQESETSGGSFANATNGTSVVAITADSTGSEINLDLRTNYRYIKIVCTITFTGGSTPEIPVSASYVLGEAKEKPAA